MAAGYLVKPLRPDKLANAMRGCRALLNEHSRVIEVPVAGGVLPLSLAGIHWAEVYDKNTLFHTVRGQIEARIALDKVESLIALCGAQAGKGMPFLRCHRSYLINMNYIEGMNEREFRMRGGGMVPIRKHGLREVQFAVARFRSGFIAATEASI